MNASHGVERFCILRATSGAGGIAKTFGKIRRLTRSVASRSDPSRQDVPLATHASRPGTMSDTGTTMSLFDHLGTRLKATVAFFEELDDMADDHDADIVAAGLSFYALLGLFPALLAVVSIYGLLADPQNVEGALVDFAQTLPPQARTVVLGSLADFVKRSSGDLTLSAVLGIVGVLWSCSSGMSVLVRAINATNSVKKRRSFFKRRLVALLFTLAGVVGVVIVIPGITALPKILPILGAGTPSLVVPPLALAVFAFGALSVLFRYAPVGRTQTFREIAPGAAAASAGWLGMSGLYSFYVRFFSSYSSTYGALEGVIVLELWFYFSALVMLYAAELNVLLARRLSAAPRS
jgi:membrane protein